MMFEQFCKDLDEEKTNGNYITVETIIVITDKEVTYEKNYHLYYISSVSMFLQY